MPASSSRREREVVSKKPTSTGSHSLKAKTFEIRIDDFDRARLFYTDALGFYFGDASNPPSSSQERLRFHGISQRHSTQGYFLKIAKPNKAALVVVGFRRHMGYQRVIFVRDIEEVKKKIIAAGGELFETTERELRHFVSRPRRKTRVLVSRTLFQDTEGNVVELRSWNTRTKPVRKK